MSTYFSSSIHQNISIKGTEIANLTAELDQQRQKILNFTTEFEGVNLHSSIMHLIIINDELFSI